VHYARQAPLPSYVMCAVLLTVCTTSVTGLWAGRTQTRTARMSGTSPSRQPTAAAAAVAQIAVKATYPMAAQTAMG